MSRPRLGDSFLLFYAVFVFGMSVGMDGKAIPQHEFDMASIWWGFLVPIMAAVTANYVFKEPTR